MAFEVVMPRLGWNMEEGALAKWRKNDGDSVSAGEILFEVESDKAIQEVEALESGILRIPKDSPQQGQMVPVGTLLGYLLQIGESMPAAEDQASPVIAQPQQETIPPGTSVQTPAPSGSISISPTVFLEAPDLSNGERLPGGHPAISPRAKRVARELGMNWRGLKASGRAGRIVERDVRQAVVSMGLKVSNSGGERGPALTRLAERIAQENYVDLAGVKTATSGGKIRKDDLVVMAASTHGGKPPMAAGEDSGTVVPLSTMRKTIARRMKESLHVAAQANHQMDLDCSEMVRMREVLKKKEIAVTYTDIMLKVLAVSLRRHPIMNSTWTDEGILLHDKVNIGVAIALEEGLVVPVLRDVDRMSLVEIDDTTRELIAKAKEGKLRQEDLEGGGFTITNLGMYAIDRFVAIINRPESGILAVGRIVDRAEVADKTVQIRPMMTISLTYDHRVMDGATAAKFLKTLKDCLESPFLAM